MKKAGESTREMAQERRQKRKAMGVAAMVIIVLLLVADFLGIFAFQGTAGGWIWDAGLSVLVLIIVRQFSDRRIERMEGLHSEETRANQGAAGEELIGTLLDALPQDDWRVFHDIQSKFGNIDHVVLHRQGHLFLIETKSHRRTKVTVDRGELRGDGREFEKNFVSQALQNTYWLRETIAEVAAEEAWIYPLVVFTDAFVPYLEPIKGVRVMNKRFLVETLTKLTAKPGSPVLWTYAELIQMRLQG